MSNLTWVTKSNVFNLDEFDENIAKTMVSIHYTEKDKIEIE